eukprot:gene14319-biopygen13025
MDLTMCASEPDLDSERVSNALGIQRVGNALRIERVGNPTRWKRVQNPDPARRIRRVSNALRMQHVGFPTRWKRVENPTRWESNALGIQRVGQPGGRPAGPRRVSQFGSGMHDRHGSANAQRLLKRVSNALEYGWNPNAFAYFASVVTCQQREHHTHSPTRQQRMLQRVSNASEYRKIPNAYSNASATHLSMVGISTRWDIPPTCHHMDRNMVTSSNAFLTCQRFPQHAYFLQRVSDMSAAKTPNAYSNAHMMEQWEYRTGFQSGKRQWKGCREAAMASAPKSIRCRAKGRTEAVEDRTGSQASPPWPVGRDLRRNQRNGEASFHCEAGSIPRAGAWPRRATPRRRAAVGTLPSIFTAAALAAPEPPAALPAAPGAGAAGGAWRCRCRALPTPFHRQCERHVDLRAPACQAAAAAAAVPAPPSAEVKAPGYVLADSARPPHHETATHPWRDSLATRDRMLPRCRDVSPDATRDCETASAVSLRDTRDSYVSETGFPRHPETMTNPRPRHPRQLR